VAGRGRRGSFHCWRGGPTVYDTSGRKRRTGKKLGGVAYGFLCEAFRRKATLLAGAKYRVYSTTEGSKGEDWGGHTGEDYSLGNSRGRKGNGIKQAGYLSI